MSMFDLDCDGLDCMGADEIGLDFMDVLKGAANALSGAGGLMSGGGGNNAAAQAAAIERARLEEARIQAEADAARMKLYAGIGLGAAALLGVGLVIKARS